MTSPQKCPFTDCMHHHYFDRETCPFLRMIYLAGKLVGCPSYEYDDEEENDADTEADFCQAT